MLEIALAVMLLRNMKIFFYEKYLKKANNYFFPDKLCFTHSQTFYQARKS